MPTPRMPWSRANRVLVTKAIDIVVPDLAPRLGTGIAGLPDIHRPGRGAHRDPSCGRCAARWRPRRHTTEKPGPVRFLPLRVGENASGPLVVQARPYQGRPRMVCAGSATLSSSATVVRMSKSGHRLDPAGCGRRRGCAVADVVVGHQEHRVRGVVGGQGRDVVLVHAGRDVEGDLGVGPRGHPARCAARARTA